MGEAEEWDRMSNYEKADRSATLVAGTVYALLAVADELRALREAITAAAPEGKGE